jgi:hypothetical protein
MRDAGLYQAILGLREPWTATNMDLDGSIQRWTAKR